MSGSSGIVAGLAFFTQRLTESKEPIATDAYLSSWLRATGWRSAGVVWPADDQPVLASVVRVGGPTDGVAPPPELPEIRKSLTGGSQTVVWQLPGSAGRLYMLLQPVGRAAGVFWVERDGTEPWSDLDRNYLLLSVRLMERSGVFAETLGPVVESHRLLQRLTDAATIAGRMAHDFDNVLTGIIGFADLTVPLVPANSQPSKYVAEIGKVGQRGITFTQQLHQLSRAGQVKPQPSSLQAVVTKEEFRLRPTMPSGLQLVTDIPPSLSAVGMDAGPLGVVIGHLIENAADASPPNARVVVSARAVELSPADATGYLGNAGPGTYIEVTVRDFGSGIRPDVRARLFAEPFYTTKVRHRGLGLAVVFRILYAHGGGIRIEPATPPDVGTTARIVIPPGVVRPPVAPAHRPTTANILGG